MRYIVVDPEAGCEFVGRLLSVMQTVKLHGGRVLEYLTEAIRSHRHGSPAPTVLAPLGVVTDLSSR